MNELGMRQFVFGCLTLAFVVTLCACSVDRNDHPDRKTKCDTGFTKVEGFCVRKISVVEDSGPGPVADTGPGEMDSGADSGVDSGPDADGGIDASMPAESCEEVGEQRLCYTDDDFATSQQSPCRPGLERCEEDHFWSGCIGQVLPKTESCDGLDNDCDGTSDEDQFQKSCRITNGGLKGACAENGLAFCDGGREQCLQRVTPKPETCNAVDDDCDGKTDEEIGEVCYGGGNECLPNATGGFDCTPASTCAPGTLRCVAGQMQTECTDDVRPRDEESTVQHQTPLDEDCDGMIDEGFSCADGEDYPCYTGPASTRGRSPCKDGTLLCTTGQFGSCMDEITPVPESCGNENRDDDCDGVRDNVSNRGTSCSDASSALGLCKANATWQCVDVDLVCVSGLPSSEICDGRNEDEDCDGMVDEDFNKQVDELNCGACGTRCANGLTCCNGMCVNTASSNANCGGCGVSCNGMTCCSSGCVNTLTNRNHCGTCGKVCILGCTNGGCLL